MDDRLTHDAALALADVARAVLDAGLRPWEPIEFSPKQIIEVCYGVDLEPNTKERWMCPLCGRNKFPWPYHPHRCGNQFRKHNWPEWIRVEPET